MRIEQVRIEHVPHLDNSTVPKVAAGVTTQFHPRIRIKPTRQAGGKDLGVKAATTVQFGRSLFPLRQVPS